MLAGTGKVVLLVGLALLQLARAASKARTMKMNASRTIADNLPMHPPRPVGSARRACLDAFSKTPSVEARIFFGKFRRLRSVYAARRNPERSEGFVARRLNSPCLNNGRFQVRTSASSGKYVSFRSDATNHH